MSWDYEQREQLGNTIDDRVIDVYGGELADDYANNY